MARRLLSLQDEAGVTVWDDGDLTCVLRAPALRYSTPAAIECELAEQLFDDCSTASLVVHERARAVAVDIGRRRRVVTVVERARLATDELAAQPSSDLA